VSYHRGAGGRHPASYRDPAGFVFWRDGQLLRQVNRRFAGQWDAFRASDLLEGLTRERRLLEFEAVDLGLAAQPEQAHAILRPARIHFISYPYEWTFGQLRDAALTTLDIQAAAIASGFSLRDAPAWNIQFHDGRPIHIDHLSFGPFEPTSPWPAYHQFCRHFLAPLALMSYRDVRLGGLATRFSDGIPLDLASTLLPRSSWMRPGMAAHLHLHSRAERSASAEAGAPTRGSMTRLKHEALVESLRRTIAGLRWEPRSSPWTRYEPTTSYTPDAAGAKERIVAELLDDMPSGSIWDLGANTGRFSRMAAEKGHRVVAMEADHGAAEILYRRVRDDRETRIMPLVIDLTNPSPAAGWASEERLSLTQRGPADVVLVLGLVHHLLIAGNVSLERLVAYLGDIGRRIIVEFIGPDDARAAALLRGREGDPPPPYDLRSFRDAIGARFSILGERPVAGSSRIIIDAQRRVS
jgi:hypothetical protein